jgi:acetyl esterase/lipase
MTFPLWPNGAPGAVGDEPADIPTLIPYPVERGDGSAVIVFPGGGYQHLADHEGEPIARWLNTLGVSAFVLRYRLAPRYKHPAMWQDAARAVRTVRSRAGEWNVDHRRIGVLGFSAGGHLAATISTQFDDGETKPADPIDRVSSRPDVSVLLYPVITLGEVSTHTGSRKNLIGPDASPERARELIEQLSAEKRVTERTPPAFVFHTADDPAVPVENAILYVSALRAAKVPFELHVYEHGRHGVGLAADDPVLKTWSTLCANWLKAHNFGSGARP